MSEAASERFHLGRVFLISVTHFFHDMYAAFLSPLLPVLIERHGLSLKMAGYLNPALKIPSLLQPFVGYFADRRKTAAVLPLTLFLTSLTMCFIITLPSYVWIVVFMLIAGLSGTFYHATAVTFVSTASGTKHGTGMSFFMTGGELARSLGPLYIVTLIRLVPENRIPFAALPALCLSVFLFLPVSSYKGEKEKRESLAFKSALIRGGRGLILLIAVGILQGFTVYSFAYFLPTYLHEASTSLFLAGSSLSVLEVSGAFGAFLGGTVSDRIGRKMFFIISSIFIPLLINLFLKQEGSVIRLFILLVTGVFMFSTNPVRYALAQDLVPEYKGTVTSLLMAIAFLTSTGASIAVGHLGDRFGLFNAYRIISLLPLLAIPFILMIPKPPVSKIHLQNPFS
jgi:FSR family fosmidomycin resistance protein-like MFS transporter